MKYHKIWPRLFWTLIIVILISPLIYWSTGIGQSAAQLSAKIMRDTNGMLADSPKAVALHKLVLPIRIERIFIYPLMLLAFQLSGGAFVLKQVIEENVLSNSFNRFYWIKQFLRRSVLLLPKIWRKRLPGHILVLILLFAVALHLGVFLLYLPFNFYQGFILAHHFGLSTQSAAGWLGDWSKQVLISLTVTGLTWTGLYGLMTLFPRRWPIPAGTLLILFSVIFSLLAPILITPLFFKVQPLQDTELRNRILTIADQVGLATDQVYVIDASAKTTTGNAYVAGFGNAQRIVFYDNLLSDYDLDQVEVILAHELGHWFHQHIFWGLVGFGAAGWIGLFSLRWLLERIWSQLGLTGPNDVAGLPFILAIISIITTLSLPIQNGISRYAESNADEFALTITQNPEAFTQLFEQLAEQNLSIVNPPVWEKLIFYTHPPTIERIHITEFSKHRQLSDR